MRCTPRPGSPPGRAHTMDRRSVRSTPPLPPPQCANASPSSHRRPTFPTCSLGPVAPSQATHCHPCALPSRSPSRRGRRLRAPTPVTPPPQLRPPPDPR
jgi:hypothetical protein